MSESIKYMDIKEFREQGYLQEVNRLFFHPLGLALAIDVAEDGTETLYGLWDDRDDLTGTMYGDNVIDPQKASDVATEWVQKKEAREKELGWMIQPVPGMAD